MEALDLIDSRSTPRIIGVTATRNGLTDFQRAAFERILSVPGILQLHHGDCVGGDEQIHDIAKRIGIDIYIHPPDDDRLRAFCGGAKHVYEPKPYLQRNRDVVDICDLLLGGPAEDVEPTSTRGHGTWSTIGCARRRKVDYIVIPPTDPRKR